MLEFLESMPFVLVYLLQALVDFYLMSISYPGICPSY